MRIIFYNNYHNGDLHFSLGFCRALVKALGLPPEEVAYAHNCVQGNALLGREDWLGTEIRPPEFCIDNQGLYTIPASQTTFVNTWVGQDPTLFKGCSFETNYLLFERVFRHFGLKITADKQELLIDRISLEQPEFIPEKTGKTALLCNGQVHSGQAPNTNINFLIPLLRDKGYLVYITAPAIIPAGMMDIYALDSMKLPEIGKLVANEVDVVIGRASGPYAFAQTRQSLMDPSKTFISFTHVKEDSIWFPEASAKQVWSNVFDEEVMKQVVLENI